MTFDGVLMGLRPTQRLSGPEPFRLARIQPNLYCFVRTPSQPDDRDARVRSPLRLCPAVRVGLDRAGWTANSSDAAVAGRRGLGRAGPHASCAGHAGPGIGLAVQRCLLVLLWQAARRGGVERAL